MTTGTGTFLVFSFIKYSDYWICSVLFKGLYLDEGINNLNQFYYLKYAFIRIVTIFSKGISLFPIKILLLILLVSINMLGYK